MASGTPVIAADAMALPHLVRPGRNGWLYRPGDVRRAGRPPHDPPRRRGLRRRMGVASRELVIEHAIGATLDRFEGIYREVDRPHRGHAAARRLSPTRSARASRMRAELSQE